jgi:arylsulfatase A-like enzyme
VDREHVISNGLDIYPTICDYAGVDLPGDLNGRSLRPIIEGQTLKEWREYVVSETFANEGNIKMHGRMVRTRKYKYIVYSWGRYREQLFDMENDPGEMVNLAVESRYETILQQHRDLLADWIEKTDDRFIRHYAHPDQLPRLPGQEY